MIDIPTLYKLYQKHPTIVIDSRKVETSCIFFALKGPRFNGNEYAKEALSKGAAYVVIDEPEYQLDERTLMVGDVLNTLQVLSRYHRRKFEIPLLAITGSNGKTTTKELLSAVLSSHYPTHFTKGNFNNHIGVPLTLLAMPAHTEVAIVEMGANHLEEIKFLCSIAEPTHGVITNIGKAHLEGFGSLEGVKKGKSELYRFLERTNGTVFINKDERDLEVLAQANINKVFYKESRSPDADAPILETKLVNVQPFVTAAFMEGQKWFEVATSLTGKYNFNNIMTAIAIGRYFKVPAFKIKEAVEGYIPTNNRSQLLKKGTNTFLMDAYNANPDSMRNALENFAQIHAPQKIAIIGDMLELGDYNKTEHEKILHFALGQKLINQVITVGEEFGKIDLDSNKRLHFTDVLQLKEWFLQRKITNTFVFLKGSRGIKLEQLVTE